MAQARSQLALSQAQLQAALAQRNQATSTRKQSQAQLQQSIHNVTMLDATAGATARAGSGSTGSRIRSGALPSLRAFRCARDEHEHFRRRLRARREQRCSR